MAPAPAGGDRPRVLVANRGEIALRVKRSCAALDLEAVAIFTQPDALSLHVLRAPLKVCLGTSPREYTNADRVVQAALSMGCVAVHPGYGFLSENVEFVRKCEAAGIVFLGPTAETMETFARKHTARAFAESAGVPVLPGSTLLASEEEAVKAAEAVGYPVLLKATGGGGGIGIYICRSTPEVKSQFAAAGRQGQASFGDAGVFVEKYVERARHIEVQLFGDGRGGCVALGERECSIQRRHQKILEESPSPFVSPELRAELVGAALALGRAAAYRSAGTVEFLVDDDTGRFYFLEVNTRLQVEHGITELCTRLDLVEWMLRLQVPGLQPPDLATYVHQPRGWAIEVRLNAEDPFRNFAPSAGMLAHVSWPPPKMQVRVDTWVETGVEVTPYYDSLLGKLMVHGPDRPAAIAKLRAALAATQVVGVPNNLEFLAAVAAAPAFAAGATTTRFLEGLPFAPAAVEVLAPGMNTTMQDWPGRVRLWAVGVPPSGPLDARSFRMANALVGNDEGAAGLELTLSGPTLKFHTDAVVALAGAQFDATLDGRPVPFWRSFRAAAGSVLAIGTVAGGAGSRAYLAVAGGLAVAPYLASRATFPSGNLGGLQGRALRAGDLLPLTGQAGGPGLALGTAMPAAWHPSFTNQWEVGVLPGPNAEPDYFTVADIDTLYSSAYTVHYNSNRLGIRLQGPRPQFARPDGGEGGSHPSNVHDHVYAIGTINYTGDMPIVLMHDGPSLGGFVCPATVTSAQLWKMGQARPDDTIRFRRMTLEEAYAERIATDRMVQLLLDLARAPATNGASHAGPTNGHLSSDATHPATTNGAAEAALVAALADLKVSAPAMPATAAVLARVPASGAHPGAILRLAGDRYVVVEYGPMELDLNLRVRVAALQEALAAQNIEGLVETSPGVRSCMIEYDFVTLPTARMLELLIETDKALPPAGDLVLPSRVLHLPLAFNCRWSNAAIAKYMKSSRSDAPYLPSNVDFVAANNGLEGGREAVAQILASASYMVLGLGDVYLGAPCAVPLDPRQRLVVPKYNPARTYTQEGTVGLGGAYLCIYPMDSPGGYQLVGRTLPIWSTWGRTPPFSPAQPWLLRNFDRVRFFLVCEDELEEQRHLFSTGQLALKIEQDTFSMREYNEFVASVAEETAALRARQRAAQAVQMALDEASLQRQAAADASAAAAKAAKGPDDQSMCGKAEGTPVTAAFTANVWEVSVAEGQAVAAGQALVVLEAMKMEFPVVAPAAGTVAAVHVAGGQLVQQGDALVTLALAATAEE